MVVVGVGGGRHSESLGEDGGGGEGGRDSYGESTR